MVVSVRRIRTRWARGSAKRPWGVNHILQKDERGDVIEVRYYHRNGGPIFGEIKSEEFLEYYLKPQKGRVPKSDTSLAGLITDYLASPEYEKLEPTTKDTYRRALDAARERWD